MPNLRRSRGTCADFLGGMHAALVASGSQADIMAAPDSHTGTMLRELFSGWEPGGSATIRSGLA